MDIPSFIVVYVCSWWISLFMVLPLWVERDEGEPSGAPKIPHLKRKFIMASIMGFIITGGVALCIHYNLISFSDIARSMAEQDYGS